MVKQGIILSGGIVMEKRTEYIGVKVTPTTKAQIEEIAQREARPVSSQINMILESYIKDYFSKEKE